MSIIYKSIAGSYRPVSVADGPITARYRFIKNASWVLSVGNLIYAKRVTKGAFANNVDPDKTPHLYYFS